VVGPCFRPHETPYSLLNSANPSTFNPWNASSLRVQDLSVSPMKLSEETTSLYSNLRRSFQRQGHRAKPSLDANSWLKSKLHLLNESVNLNRTARMASVIATSAAGYEAFSSLFPFAGDLVFNPIMNGILFALTYRQARKVATRCKK